MIAVVHHTDAGRLEIVIALPLPVRVDEELHAGILVDIPTEIHLTGGSALLEHIETKHEVASGMECAKHYTGFIWRHFRPIVTVQRHRLALGNCEEQCGGIIRIDIYMLDYHNVMVLSEETQKDTGSYGGADYACHVRTHRVHQKMVVRVEFAAYDFGYTCTVRHG